MFVLIVTAQRIPHILDFIIQWKLLWSDLQHEVMHIQWIKNRWPKECTKQCVAKPDDKIKMENKFEPHIENPKLNKKADSLGLKLEEKYNCS